MHCTRHQTNQLQFGRIKKMNSLQHTKANICLHLDSNSWHTTFWATPIGLVIHSKVAAVRRKVALPLRLGCVCLKWIWVFLPGWRKEGWPSVRLALCSGSPCELSRLQWAWTILPGLARQALHCLTMKSPCCVRNFHRLQVPWGFNGTVCLHTSQILLYSHSLEQGKAGLLIT